MAATDASATLRTGTNTGEGLAIQVQCLGAQNRRRLHPPLARSANACKEFPESPPGFDRPAGEFLDAVIEAGISLFLARSATIGFSIDMGGNTSIMSTGVIYAPESNIVMKGTTDVTCSMLICYSIDASKGCKRRNKSAAGGGAKVQRPANTYPAHCGVSTRLYLLCLNPQHNSRP